MTAPESTRTIAGSPRTVGRARGRRRSTGWVPNQHGAWAMLIVPYVIGVALAVREGRFAGYAIPLFAFWMLGYFCFHAASQWLKSRRAARFVRPMLTYAALAAPAGLTTWVVAGWPLALWVMPYAPVLIVALVLAANRHERDLIGGLLTVAAACLILLVVGHRDPRGALLDPASLLLAAICFGYFAGTVWVVKTMIRERGKPGWVVASIGWHLVATVLAGAAAVTGVLPWWPTVFFAATTVRAAALPLAWPMRGRRLSAARVGIVEIGFSCVLLLLAIAVGVS